MSRAPGAEREVSPLELFFDLVYVFAVGQLSHHLVAHLDLRTGVETGVLALAVFYAWYMTAWGANWLEPDRLTVRAALVVLMFTSLLMSAGIDGAFEDRAWLFVLGYLSLQVARASFLIVALRGRPQSEHFVNDLVWELLTGVLWVAGAFADRDQRLTLWVVAAVVTYAAAGTVHWLPGRGRRVEVGHTEIAAGHLIERFRLFFIIVLGETVLTTGNSFAGAPFELSRLGALVLGFAGTVALWWCYFERSEGLGIEAAERSEDAGAVGLWGTWTLTLIVIALIGIAVADELAIAHPHDGVTAGFAVLAFGGSALFLIAQIIFQRQAVRRYPRTRLLAVVAFAIVAVLTSSLTLIVGIAASTAVLIAVAIGDTVQELRRASRTAGPRHSPLPGAR